MKIVTKDNASEIVSRLRNAADAYVLPSYLEDSNTIRPEDFNALKDAILSDRRVVFQFHNDVDNILIHINTECTYCVAVLQDDYSGVIVVFPDRNEPNTFHQWNIENSGRVFKEEYRLATQTDLSGKVSKVTGKGLSTNDFTDAYKTKLDQLSVAETLVLKVFPSVNTSLTQSQLNAIGLTSSAISNLFAGKYHKVKVMMSNGIETYLMDYSCLVRNSQKFISFIGVNSGETVISFCLESQSSGAYYLRISTL